MSASIGRRARRTRRSVAAMSPAGPTASTQRRHGRRAGRPLGEQRRRRRSTRRRSRRRRRSGAGAVATDGSPVRRGGRRRRPAGPSWSSSPRRGRSRRVGRCRDRSAAGAGCRSLWPGRARRRRRASGRRRRERRPAPGQGWSSRLHVVSPREEAAGWTARQDAARGCQLAETGGARAPTRPPSARWTSWATSTMATPAMAMTANDPAGPLRPEREPAGGRAVHRRRRSVGDRQAAADRRRCDAVVAGAADQRGQGRGRRGLVGDGEPRCRGAEPQREGHDDGGDEPSRRRGRPTAHGASM